MSKLKEELENVSTAESNWGNETKGRETITDSHPDSSCASDKRDQEDNSKQILRFTMLINKFNSDLDMTTSGRNGEEPKLKRDIKAAMFFNKEVTIRSNGGASAASGKSLEPREAQKAKMESKGSPSSVLRALEAEGGWQPSGQITSDTLVNSPKRDVDLPSDASVCFGPDEFEDNCKVENLKKVLTTRNDGCKSHRGGEHVELRIHNSLTSLSKNIKLGLRGVLKSKIASMTAIETNSSGPIYEGQISRCWEDNGKQEVPSKCLNLQISKSNNDSNNRRSAVRFKKEETGSASDSKLLNADIEKKTIKKCDKKSRGDSTKKEADIGGVRKQVQWKTEVDVIYFSTHLEANRERPGEVIGRVMEPLREEWEQQRKGFYAKIVPYHIESHLKDHFISLLKI